MEELFDKNPRIEVVDALRGFAVLAILLVHSLEHFIYPVYPQNTLEWMHILDQGIFHTVFSLFAGKAYAIFALLFGFTFYIQANNQKKAGKDFGYRFLWRLLLLAGFATINAAFFPAGDVLLLFAVVGLVLFLTRNWSEKAILITAVLFLLQPVEWCHYVAYLLNPAYQLPDFQVVEMYEDVAACTEDGNIGDFILCNVTMGQQASLLLAVNAGRFSQTAGLFLLGFYIGKKQFFVSSEKNLPFWTKVLAISAILFAPLYTLKEVIMDGDTIIRQTAGTAFDMWQKLAFTGVLVASFILLYQNRRFRSTVDCLHYYGRMSLTNYLSQSVIGAFIYFPVGLGLASLCGYTTSLLVGIVIFLMQIIFSDWWLWKHRQGPLERLWHKWTWWGANK